MLNREVKKIYSPWFDPIEARPHIYLSRVTNAYHYTTDGVYTTSDFLYSQVAEPMFAATPEFSSLREDVENIK